MTVRDIDYGMRKMFQRVLKRDPMRVQVGIQGEANEDEGDRGISNVRLAGVHEFGAEIATRNGTISIPERSFIRATVDENTAIYRGVVQKLAEKVLVGAFDVSRALGILGEKVTSDIKGKIERGIDPPNAESTIAAKGSSKPLIDTGQLKNAITYQVIKDAG